MTDDPLRVHPVRVDPERPWFLGGPPEPTAADGPAPTPRPADPRVPGEPGLWVFLLGDMTLFGAFFVGLLAYRIAAPEVFRASARTLSVGLGTVNTVVLLTSSLAMALAVRAVAERRAPGTIRRLLLGVLACAVVFASIKVTEYALLADGGHGPQGSVFVTLYIALTGIHLLHVAVGAVLVATLVRVLSTSPEPATRTAFARGVASYWHMVDLLWLVLFPLLYLVSAS